MWNVWGRSQMSQLVVVVAVVLLGSGGASPVQALEPLVPYDKFHGKSIDPTRWVGYGGADLNVREVERVVKGKSLRLANRAYANTLSDAGEIGGGFGLAFWSFDVTGAQFTVAAQKLDVTDCSPSRASETTRAGAGFRGKFFSTVAKGPGDQTGDVDVAIGIEKDGGPNSGPNERPLRVIAFYSRCDDATCGAFTVLAYHELGPIGLGDATILTVQWDQANHQFIFKRDLFSQVVSPYTVSDSNPPSIRGGLLVLGRVVANCTTLPRPTVDVEATFDNVLINQSAAP
jgi:hypothetical protein